MKSTKQTLEYIAEEIGHVYFRPLMYGGDAEGVDLLLYNYHKLWAVITDREKEFTNLSGELHKEQDCGAANFSTAYKIKKPGADEQETAFYVVDQWQKASNSLGIPIPYEKLRSLLGKLLKYGNTNKILNEKLFA